MPFRSEKQRRYMWKFHPEIAERWTKEHGSTPKPKKKVKKRGTANKSPVRRGRAKNKK